jgi:hypothetical protein
VPRRSPPREVYQPATLPCLLHQLARLQGPRDRLGNLPPRSTHSSNPTVLSQSSSHPWPPTRRHARPTSPRRSGASSIRVHAFKGRVTDSAIYLLVLPTPQTRSISASSGLSLPERPCIQPNSNPWPPTRRYPPPTSPYRCHTAYPLTHDIACCLPNPVPRLHEPALPSKISGNTRLCKPAATRRRPGAPTARPQPPCNTARSRRQKPTTDAMSARAQSPLP